MALIECSECGSTVSEMAAACPKCGAPVGKKPLATPVRVLEQPRTVSFWLGVGVLVFPLVFSWFLLRKGHSTTSRVIGFVWLGLSLLAMTGQQAADTSSGSVTRSNSISSSSAPQTPRPAPVEQPLLQVTASQLAQAYDRNTVAADQQFKGKRFLVTGVVDSINTDFLGRPYLTLRGGVNQFMEPQFELDRAHESSAAKLQAGMRVSLVCTGSGDIAKTPMSKSCKPAD
ncbi:OB-fold protein [Halopseudomonas maritima]|uniref:OB-fold protein n=1 Tax=Halopseudomonas maritima TaxID=2918528 RepID=UPI001EEBAF1E|nr:hypothetical protein [Halopseudomonas maritima]UJJ31830.1 hypothetical protein HV822_01215 [Halopseudomonas maritima]